MLWWMTMSNRGLAALRLIAAAAAFSVLATIGWGSASAAPTADDQGYLNSTARCDSAGETVLFGSTTTSRVAICKVDGEYVYRGVRLRDGAKLVVPATKSGDEYTADNDGITYTVTDDSLVVSAGSRVIREETMTDINSAQTSEVGESPPAADETPTPTTPLPPPLPAEVGGESS
jgi:hypothetical protein